MKPLDAPDIHLLRAAEGWLELGDNEEALRELEAVSPRERNHPAVLEMRFQIFAKKAQWEVCRDLAEQITKQLPAHSAGWLHLAYATRRAVGGGVRAALEILQPMADRFPKEPTIPYNLSCYCCQLGLLADARSWLKKSFVAGNMTELKLMALSDRDLQALWEEIPRMEA